VETLYALRTYDEILIAVPAQLHTPVARPKSLLTGKDVKAANCGQAAGSSGSTCTGSTCCA
jgi:hypothetical protein